MFYRVATAEAEGLYLPKAQHFRRHVIVRQLQEVFAHIAKKDWIDQICPRRPLNECKQSVVQINTSYVR